MAIVAVLAVTACHSVRYVPVEHVRVDSVQVLRTRIDTIREREDVRVEVKGDTILKTRIVERDRVQLRVDTVAVERYVEKPTPYEVVKQPSVWEKIKTASAGAAIAAVLLIILAVIWRWKKG